MNYEVAQSSMIEGYPSVMTPLSGSNFLKRRCGGMKEGVGRSKETVEGRSLHKTGKLKVEINKNFKKVACKPTGTVENLKS